MAHDDVALVPLEEIGDTLVPEGGCYNAALVPLEETPDTLLWLDD